MNWTEKRWRILHSGRASDRWSGWSATTGNNMTTQLPVRADGNVLFRFTAGAFAFEVLSTPAELEHCCNFLADGATGVGTVRLGLFGPYEVRVTRGSEDWMVRVHVSAPTGDGSEAAAQCIGGDMRRMLLLKALTQFMAPPAPVDTPPAPVHEPAAAREMPARADAGTDRRVLHTAADLRRLVIYVATHWTVPRVEMAIDRFAELDRQRAQTLITRLAGISEYQSLGAWAAVVTVILGTIRIVQSFNQRTIEQRFVDTYVSSAGLWEYAVGLAVAAGCAWFAGKWLGALWCRLRLLLALFRLWLRARSLESKA
jgi:hypothetical protein